MKYEISAGGIVFRKKNSKTPKIQNSKSDNIEWLVVQHAEHGGWVFPKGIVGDTKHGESLEEGAIRETQEEGGVDAKIIERIPNPNEYFYKRDGGLHKKTVHYYLMEYLSGDPANHDHEIKDAKFITTEEVKKILTYKNDLTSFESALNILRAVDQI